MSAKKQSKRKNKIATVMREFKAGDLKSGGSGRKVTNPKQAIAIALSEANAMNQGGMMYNEIMNRPMFQTPQMRQGGGIMAGVAPIRGYAEGDLVEDDDSIIASLLSQAEELPEVLSNLTMDDAIGFVKENPEVLLLVPGLGQYGLAARGLQFGARGLQRGGQKLASLIRGPRKVTEADLAAPKPGPRTMGGRDIMGTNVASREPSQRIIRQGERFDSRAQRTEAQSARPSTTRKMEDSDIASPSQSAAPNPASRKADAPKAEGGIKSLGQRAAGTIRKGVGIAALTGATGYLLKMPIVQDLINQGFGIDELMEMPEIRALLGSDMDEYAEKSREELFTDPTKEKLRQITGQDPLTAPDNKEAMARLREAALASEAPAPPEQPDPIITAPSKKPNILERLGGALTDISGAIGSEKDLIRMGQSTGERRSGRPIRNLALERFKAGEEYDKALREADLAERAMQVSERGPRLEQEFEFIKSKSPDTPDQEILDRLLTRQESARDAFISLYTANVPAGMTPSPELIKQLSLFTGYEMTPEEIQMLSSPVGSSPSAVVD